MSKTTGDGNYLHFVPPAPWQSFTPTADDLEGMPLDWFHAAVDELLAETREEAPGE